jgi:hypothetical protein
MNKELYDKMATLWSQVTEKTLDPVDKTAVKKKFDDRKDKDIDNDGDTDSTDKYLHKRRKAISKAVTNEDSDEMTECPECDGSTENHDPDCPRAEKGDKKKIDEKDLDQDNTKKALKHDCASHVTSEQWGYGECLAGEHTLVEQEDGTGVVTHYTVMFEHGVELVSVEELTVVKEKSHIHAGKKPPFEGPYSKSDKETKDRFGNVVKKKNLAKHLAKKGMSKFAKKESYTPEDVESMIDAAIDSLLNEKTREKKTGESALDKFKGKGAKDMAADGNVGSPKEADITPEEEGHDDASKAAKVTKPAKARSAGDQLSNGDKTIVKGGTK